MPHTHSAPFYIGLMSGTSLDGVDGVLAAIPDGDTGAVRTLASAYLPFPASLRQELMALQAASDNELHREAVAANALASIYADCVEQLLQGLEIKRDDITAIGVHGQTIRHRPELGYTRQTNNPALLAELTGINVIADFRSRDIAAGGQGAPLVPAFHHAVFGDPEEVRVVVNIGGMANISILSAETVTGFDTGPGNALMDAWILRHRRQAYDQEGKWAANGTVLPDLLAALRAEPYFLLAAPKSTGRDLFHPAWLDAKLMAFPGAAAADVQATLAALTATTIADAIHSYAERVQAVYVCGGGAYNPYLMQQLQSALANLGHSAKVASSDNLGISPNHVEALAFAWLAQRLVTRRPGNLPAVTGAKGLRLLGALYPA